MNASVLSVAPSSPANPPVVHAPAMGAPLVEAPLDRLPADPAPRPAASPADRRTDWAALTARCAGRAGEADRHARFPHENFADLHAAGLIGAVVDRRYGGAGASLAQAREIIAAVAAGCASTALVLTMTYLQHQAIGRLSRRWPAALREAVLGSAVTDGALVNALRVEPALGSPARGGLPATIARRTADGWRLNGHKIYSTGAPALTWLVVWARTDEDPPRVGSFLVPRDTPGVRIVETWDHLGLRASGSHDVLLTDVDLPVDHAVDLRAPADWAPGAGGENEAADFARQTAWMVVLLGSLYDAVARAAADWLIGFLRTRIPENLGQPLSTVPRIQQTVGEIQALLWSNRQLLTSVASAVDEGRAPSPADSGLLKRQVTRQSIEAVELALTLSGNHGLSRRHPLERHHRDVLCSRIHTPQDDSILVAAGRLALGV